MGQKAERITGDDKQLSLMILEGLLSERDGAEPDDSAKPNDRPKPDALRKEAELEKNKIVSTRAQTPWPKATAEALAEGRN